MEADFDREVDDMVLEALGFIETFAADPAQAPEIAQRLLEEMAEKLARMDWVDYFEKLKFRKITFDEQLRHSFDYDEDGMDQ